MNKNLRDFLRMAKEAGPDFYMEVKRPINTHLEICVLQQKLAKEGCFPVIYIPGEMVGSKFPLVTNVFGSYELLGLMLGIEPKKRAKSEILHEYRKREASPKPPQVVPSSEAPVKEVILRGKDIDLGILPICHHAELDSGKYITVGSLICKDPDTGIPNVGVYRHEVKGKDQLGCMTNPVNHGGYIARRYAQLGKPMEVVIFIGHHPAVILGSLYKGGQDTDELGIMGGMLEEPLQMTSAETVDIPVPAHAEIAIEGVIDARNMVTDGPFAEYSGYYGEGNKPCYLMQITAITMRGDAIYHGLDAAHQEHNLAGVLPAESFTYDVVKKLVPTTRAAHLPAYAGCAFHVFISIEKQVPGQGKLAGMAAVTARDRSKVAIVVDDDIDVYDEKEVWWAVATRVTGDLDIDNIPGVVGAHLDPTSYDETRLKRGPITTRTIIDATKPVNLPFPTRITPPKDLWKSMNLDDYLK